MTMVVLELLFFAYWEFKPTSSTAFNLMIEENSNICYFDVLILPYLIMNRSIHSELQRFFGNIVIFKISGSSIDR
uniref:Secreted protein n=1 Tax=Heterorhabditis bacteriophora TaxID=37862 RepID=A0A1I7WQG2_HETBA